MKKMWDKKIFAFVGGAEPLFSLEHRIFNLFSFFITLFALIAATINFLIGLAGITIWLSLAGALLSFLLFYFSRFHKIFSVPLLFGYAFISIGLLSGIYFFSGGMGGTVLYVFVMLLNVYLLIVPPRFQYLIFGILYTSMMLLVGVEYYFPEAITPFQSQEEKLLDFGATLFYSMFFTTIVIVVFRRSYYKERKRVMIQNTTLKILYNQIEIQRKELQESVLLANQRHENIKTLLNELNHRVKNNLQVVSSLLKLQAQAVTDENARQAILESRSRLQSMVLVHQRLYLDENAHQVFMPDYLQELSESVMRTYHGKIDPHLVSYTVEPVWLQVEKAIPVGLISNELITNCFKHALEKDPSSRIEVKLTHTGEQHMLTVADNGGGFQGTIPAKSFGLELVKSLVTQLNGTYQIRTENGTCWEIYFN